MVGTCIRLVHSALVDVVHSRLCHLALEHNTWRLDRRKFYHLIQEKKKKLNLHILIFYFNPFPSHISLHHKQKLRTIVRIDEDVTQLREKMQQEKKRIANS